MVTGVVGQVGVVTGVVGQVGVVTGVGYILTQANLHVGMRGA